MKRFIIVLIIAIECFGTLCSQTNIVCTNTVAEQLMLGQ